MNERNAKKIKFEELYPGKSNWPTYHYEYECPCGKGVVIYENVPGFGDSYALIKCRACEKKYRIEYGNGYLWELVER